MAPMNTEWSDAELDAFWAAQLEGRPLPPRMTAQTSSDGNQLVISDPPARAIWTRRTPPPGRRAWGKIIVLG